MDRRAVAESASAERRLGSDAIYAITGLNCDAGHAAPKMRWLLDRLEERPRHLAAPATFVTGWLSGRLVQDHANASSSMLYDVTARAWSERMLDAFAIDQALLPPIVEASEEIGTLAADIAGRLGLDATCRIIAGTGDDHAGAVGTGAVRPGIVVDIAGTAEPIGTTTAAPVFDSERLVEAHAHAVPRVSFIENAGFVSGGSILWAARLLGIDQASVFARAAEAAPGANGLTFLPALSGSMTPRWNANARGSFTGLTMEHGPAELCRAVLEGCVYAAKDVIDRLAAMGLPVDEVRVTGGGVLNAIWLQIKADATGRPTRAAEHQASPLGAACLAAVAAGWFPGLEAASASAVKMSPRDFAPNPATAAAYADGYRRYRRAFDALEPTFDEGGVPQ
jgi:xylulokinase